MQTSAALWLNYPVSDKYPDFLREVDAKAAQLTAYYRPHLVCRAGCSSCCSHDLSVFEVEAAVVLRALLELPGSLQQRITLQARQAPDLKLKGKEPGCPLLVDDRCAIYEARPVICRTQGLPLLYIADDGNQEVDFCRLNFTLPCATADLDENHLVQLDELNCRLALTYLSYCRDLGLTPGRSGTRRSMSSIVLEAAEFQTPKANSR